MIHRMIMDHSLPSPSSDVNLFLEFALIAGDGGGNDSRADMDGAIFCIFKLTTLLSLSNLG